MWGDGELTTGADRKGVEDMNWAGVVNCAYVNEDCVGVDVNCLGVDLDDVCAGADDDCTGVDNVWVGLDEVCAVEDVELEWQDFQRQVYYHHPPSSLPDPHD